eukprot:14159401-Ditylum_brightwellii.AAC.1
MWKRVQQYHGNNSVFKSAAWGEHYGAMQQLPTEMSGVGAHHQNSVSEQSIGTVVCSARTMILHATIYWPDVSDIMLWPFALQYAVHLWNNMLSMNTGLAPLDIFSGIVAAHKLLLDSHVWGYPTDLLDPALHDGKKLPKWHPHKCRGQFLGWSHKHVSNAALVQNLTTGSITPQFYTVMDNWFTTIVRIGTEEDFQPLENWEK